MSFFPVRSKSESKGNVYDCDRCNLNDDCKTPQMEGSGNRKADILIIGEAPGRKEDEKGIPFIGESGQLLRSTLKSFGINPEKDCFITNVVRCRPPKNRTPSIKETRCCFVHLEKDIKEVNPKLIVPLGGVACKAVLGDGVISKYSSYVIPFKKYNCFVIPTFHPAKVIRDYEYQYVFENDLERIKDFKNEAPEFVNFDDGNTVLEEFDDVIRTLQNIRKNRIKFALDWETYPLRPYNNDSRIISCGIAIGVNESYTFLVEDAWKEKQFEQVKIEFQKLFISKCVKVFFNYKFEKDWALNRLGADITGDIRDMMLASYLENEVKGTHNLDFQSLVNFGAGKIKEAEKYKRDMRKCPKPLLHDYNGRDSRLTYAIEDYKWDDLDRRQRRLYNDLLLEGTDALLEAEKEGVLIDLEVMKKVRKKLIKKQDKAIDKLSMILAHKRLIGEWDGLDDKRKGVVTLLNSTTEVSKIGRAHV